MRTASGLFLAVLVVLGISSCGAMTQDAPAAKTSTAKVILKLPAGVSMKPGGTILSSNTSHNNAIVTGVTLSVTAADITTPLTADIPLDTLMVSVSVPAGPARTFTVTVKTDTGGNFSGSQTVDLAANSSTDIVITVSTAPSAPTGVNAAVGNGQITVSWTASAGATSYNIYYKTSAGATIANGTKVTGATSGAAITGLVNGTTYYFVVTAVNAAGESPVSSEVSATPTAPPAAPTGVTATLGNTQVTVGWTASTGAASYNIYYKTSAGVTIGGTGVTKITGATSGAAITGLVNGTTYYFVVTAVNVGGESPISTEVSATPQVPAPAAPTGLVATPGNATVGLTWNTVAAIPNATITYTVYRSTVSGVQGSAIATGVIAANYTDSTVVNGTTYYYEVAAVDAGGASATTSQVSATPQVPAPGVPTGVNATLGNTQVTVSWTAVTGASSYNIYYRTAAGVTIANGTKVTGAVSPKTITGLVNGTTYYFVVTAVNAGGESAVSSEVSTTPQVPAPAAPTGLGATPGNATVGLSWTAVAAIPNATITYTVTRVPAFTAPVTGLTSTFYTDNAVTNGTSYSYTVSAVDAGGTSAASSLASATPQVPAPAVPTGLGATPGNATVGLSWTAVAAIPNATITYTVTRVPAFTAPVTGLTSAFYTDNAVTNGTSYSYTVSAVDAGGTSAASSLVSATPQVPTPATPTGLGATPGNATVGLAWTAVAAIPNATITYTVYRSTTSGVQGSAIATGLAVTNYTDSTVTNGTTYYYEVAAVDAGGTSAASSQVSATPQVPAPAAPTGLTATPGNATVGLSWNAVAAIPNATITYTVYRSTTSGVQGSAIATGLAATNYTDSTVANGTIYYYEVAAVDAGGTSATSSQVSAAPVATPAGPTALSAIAGSLKVTLSWTPPSGTVSSYNVYYNTSAGVTVGGVGVTKVTGAASGGAITLAANNTTYYFVVTAVNAGGESPVSGEASATTWKAPRFAYVPNAASNTVSIYTVDGATGVLRHNGYVTAGTVPVSAAVLPSGKFAYVVNQVSNNIYAYSVNPATGGLTPAGTPTATGTGPISITVDPTGQFAYAANWFDGTVSAYTVNSLTGALTPVAGSPFLSGTNPYSVAVDPTGKFAYVANYGSANVSVYTINPATGALTAGTAATAGTSPQAVTVDPTGKFVYVADYASNNVSAYTINPANGTLTAVAGSPFATGVGPAMITVEPSGRFAYVANWIDGTVSAYTVNSATGALTAFGTPVLAGINPYSVTVDPSGKSAYVSNTATNTVSVYSINQTTGALTPSGTINTQQSPSALAMTGGTLPVTYLPKYAYAANRGSSDVSAYTVNSATGALTAVGTPVAAGGWPDSVTVDPTGRFAYVSNAATNNVSAYTINSLTGALTAVTGSPFAAGTSPQSVTVDPSGRFAYVANAGSANVSVYTINQSTGALAAGTAVAAGTTPQSVAVDPSGQFAYAANYGSANVSVYMIDPIIGALTPVGTPAASGTAPYSVTVDPTGRFVYVANQTDNTVWTYSINQIIGTLTAVGTPVASGTCPFSVSVDPFGRFAYVANGCSNNVSAYTIGQSTGALTAVAGSPFAAGTTPESVTVDPTGQFAYAANANSNDVWTYTVNQTTGALTAGTPVFAGTNPFSVTIMGAIQ